MPKQATAEKAAVARDDPVPQFDQPDKRGDSQNPGQTRIADQTEDTQARPAG